MRKRHKSQKTVYKTPQRRLVIDGKISCGNCKELLSPEDFYKAKKSKLGVSWACKKCQRIYASQYAKETYQVQADFFRLRKYGISSEEYSKRCFDQKVCGICGIPIIEGPNTHLDHCHKTGKLRKFLCHKCNHLLRQAQDSIPILERAILYLKEFSGEKEEETK